VNGMHGLKSRAECMLENYAARLRIGQCGSERNAGLRGPAQRYAEAMERQDRILAATRASLDSAQVPRVLRVFYVHFALRLGKLVHKAWGEHALREEALILIMTWRARGLNPALMRRIAREVFGLELAEDGKCEARSKNDD
jgi:hypothetical protein